MALIQELPIVDSELREIAVLFEDLDATKAPYRSDIIHPDDIAATYFLDAHDVRPVHVTARNASRMGPAWRQTGYQDSILGGGTTFYFGGVEAEECRIWLDSDMAATIIAKVTERPLARYIGYNGAPMVPAHKNLLKHEPAKTMPVVCFTFETRSHSEEDIRHALAELGLAHLFLEIAPYHGSEELHYAQIARADKGVGVQTYQELTGLDISESATVGDSGPDRRMHPYTALRFVMGNSTPELLASPYPYQRVKPVNEQGYSEVAKLIVRHNLDYAGV